MSFDAVLIADSSENSDLYYATNFSTEDPVIYIQTRKGYKVLVVEDFEVERAKKESVVDNVISQNDYAFSIEKKGKKLSLANVVDEVLKEFCARKVLVPSTLSIQLADELRKKGYTLTYKEGALFEERNIKSKEEIRFMEETQRATEKAMKSALKVIKESTIKKGMLYHDGKVLTSEKVRKIINIKLMEYDCIVKNTIVSCGDAACSPHNTGSGPLKPNQAIVIDIFPKSLSGYYADLSRTIVKGKASKELKKMYNTVRAAQKKAISMVKEGVNSSSIYESVCEFFEKKGYKTETIDGVLQGFAHGLGHGIGLDIHEPISVSRKGQILKAGNVITIEPGLYYPGIGGVRLEDMLVVTKGGCKNLTRFKKKLEL